MKMTDLLSSFIAVLLPLFITATCNAVIPPDKRSKPSHERPGDVTAFREAGHVIVDLHAPI